MAITVCNSVLTRHTSGYIDMQRQNTNTHKINTFFKRGPASSMKKEEQKRVGLGPLCIHMITNIWHIYIHLKRQKQWKTIKEDFLSWHVVWTYSCTFSNTHTHKLTCGYTFFKRLWSILKLHSSKRKREMINVRRPSCMTVAACSDLTSTFTDELPEHGFNWPFYYLNFCFDNKRLSDIHLILSNTQADTLACSSFAPFAACLPSF